MNFICFESPVTDLRHNIYSNSKTKSVFFLIYKQDG